MKKQEFTSISLKLKKINIANLVVTGGAGPNVSEKTNCCSKPPLCWHTVTTRPDSLQAEEDKVNIRL
ncbi:hypothetical protein [Kordia sp.]|uniref:hypothetical protein n=1 Tax=Kordia sp. TaxID=1965332 RepID=UPI003D2BD601